MDRNFVGDYTKGQNLNGIPHNGRPVSYAGQSIPKSHSLQMVRSASFSSTQESQTSDATRRRRRLTSEETRVLCEEFEKNQKPNSKTRVKLAMQIPGMTARAIQIWFQNKRAKFKQTKRPETIPSTGGVGGVTTSPLPQRNNKAKVITKKRNSSASTSPHHAGSVSIRRYASEGELDTLKKEEEESLNAWMEEFSKTVNDDPSMASLYSPTSPSSDREGSLPPVERKLVDPDFNLANKEKKPRSRSAPNMPSDFDFQFENLTLEQGGPGLESLEHYAAHLIKDSHVNEEGDFIFNKLSYKIDSIPPPPQMAPPGLNDHRIRNLYPNLSLHVPEEDPGQTLRKTKSVPNISTDSFRDSL